MRVRNGVTAAAAVLLVAGCGGGESAGFGREAVRGEIRGVVGDAGLPESDLPVGGKASGTAAPATERERVARRAAACSAGWQYIGPAVAGSRERYEKALTGLAGAGWKQSGKRVEEPLGTDGGELVQVTFSKQGWTLLARHSPLRALNSDAVSLIATEDACMKQFSEKELDLLGGEGGGSGAS